MTPEKRFLIRHAVVRRAGEQPELYAGLAGRMEVLLLWMEDGRLLFAGTDSVTGHRPGEIG